VRLAVRLTPRADADRLDGWSRDEAGRPGAERPACAPRPTEGEANAALEALLAKALFRPKSAVRVVKGGSARLKQVEIDGVDDDALQGLGGGR
jgi:uncharacterized protein YggU (UPF0235/DUF167 family)